MTDVERRTAPQPVEYRAATDGALGTITGYAIVFDSPSRDLGGWVEVIDPAAVGDVGDDGALDLERHGRVLARTNHDSSYLLGTTDSGALRLHVDDVGLRYEVDLPGTSYARDLAALAERGDIRFSSFAFRVLPEGATWEYGRDDELVRRVTSLQLVDVAPVADPAYWGTTSEMQRDFDLSAIRSSLESKTAADAEVAPDARRATLGRAIQMQDIIERGQHGYDRP